MPEPSLELIQTMRQRALDSLGLLREDVGNLRRRVGRIEHSINGLRGDNLDFIEADTARQDATDRIVERLEAVETHVGMAPKR